MKLTHHLDEVNGNGHAHRIDVRVVQAEHDRPFAARNLQRPPGRLAIYLVAHDLKDRLSVVVHELGDSIEKAVGPAGKGKELLGGEGFNFHGGKTQPGEPISTMFYSGRTEPLGYQKRSPSTPATGTSQLAHGC